MYLTKSDFIVARTCPTKLFFKKNGYPSLRDDDPYMEFLADGGYMVETMAKLLYPDGREIGNWDKPEQAFEETQKALAAGNGTLFEATVINDKMLARHDILQRFGKTLRLIEVKSSSVDTAEDGENPLRGKRGGIASEWRKYIEDAAFQVVVLRRAFPNYEILPFLCVVDKARTATVNSTFDKSRVHRGEGLHGRFRPHVEYTGDASRLPQEHVLAILNITDEVAELEDEVAAAADELAASIDGDAIKRIAPIIGLHCKKCEYRLPLNDTDKNGFRECWGRLAEPDPHVLDLYRIDLVGGKNSEFVARLAVEGKSRLSDVPESMLSGATADRQRLQLEYTAKGREFIDPELIEILSRHKHPLRFVDFEASRLAIPYHVHMHPYEIAAFQWSCHTVQSSGGSLSHAEWLNNCDAFPNFEFARTLKGRIGDEGTVYIWSHYEVDVLREIRRQMDEYGEKDSDLASWLDRMTAKGNPRVVDLLELARLYYFHPRMKGSLSIKHVLPAAWEADAGLRADPVFAEYVGHDASGKLLNPYDTLPPWPIAEKDEVVKEGTGAMRVYQEMMFGVAASDPSTRENYPAVAIAVLPIGHLRDGRDMEALDGVINAPGGMFMKHTTQLLLVLSLIAAPWRNAAVAGSGHDFGKWENEIAAFESMDRTNPPPKGAILFVGSSMIRRWKTLAQDFSGQHVMNRGFGGSEIVDATHFAERIIFPYEPRMIFFRAGGNDLWAGKSPEVVFADFQDFVAKVRTRLPETDIVFISWSPTPARWKQADKERKLNTLVEQYTRQAPRLKYIETYDMVLGADGLPRADLFGPDKLHFNAEGYRLLASRVRPFLTP